VTVAFVDAADLTEGTGQRIQLIELIVTRAIEIHFVRRDQRPERQRIVLDEFDRGPIILGSIVERKIQATQFTFAEPQAPRPKRKHGID
jgi:hypothetical protein